MSRSEQQLWEQLQRADAMHFGEAQQALMEEVIRHADAQGLRTLAFHARRRLASAYSVDRQWHKAFPLFSRCLAEYDQNPGQFGPREDWELRQWYVNIAQSMAEFPEISLDQLMSAFADMERRFAAGGHQLREVYSARRWVAQLACDWNEEERAYRQWLAAGGGRPDSVWDFEAEIERLVFRGDAASEAKALELARPALTGQLTFREDTTPIRCLMLLPLARNGEGEQAARQFRLAIREMNESVYRYEYAGMLAEFCALTGNIEDGLIQVQRRLRGFPTLNRPNGRMEFATSATVALQRFDSTEDERLVGWGVGEEPSISIHQMRADMQREALDLATKFDARNGTTQQGDRIRAKLNLQPVADFVALTPTSRPPFRVEIPPESTPEERVEQAEWHYRAVEFDAAEQWLAALPEALPAGVEARRNVLRALLAHDAGTEPTLRQAAEQLRCQGADRQWLLTLSDLARFVAGQDNRAQEAWDMATFAVAELEARQDRWAQGWAQFRLAQVMLRTDQLNDFEPITRAIDLLAEFDDAHAVGVICELFARIQLYDGQEPQRLIKHVLNVKDALMDAGMAEGTISLFNTLKEACDRSGTPHVFVDTVREQLEELREFTPAEVVGYLRYHRGLAAFHEGRPADALPDLTEGVAEAYRHSTTRAEQWFYLALAAHYAGEADQAIVAAEKAAGWTEDWRNKGRLEQAEMADHAQLLLCHCYRNLGLPNETLQAYDQLVKQCREFSNYGTLAEGLQESAELLVFLNDYGEALSRLDEAAALYRGVGNAEQEQRCLAAAQQLRGAS